MRRKVFDLDTSDFKKKFRRITKDEIPDLLETGVKRAGAEVIRDSIREVPRAPKLTGHLHRSQTVEDPEVKGNTISVKVGFNVIYAARLHEAPKNWNWTLPGSGPKFVESKLRAHKDKYAKIPADFVKKHSK